MTMTMSQLCVTLVIVVLTFLTLSEDLAQTQSIWPQPLHFTTGNTDVAIDPSSFQTATTSTSTLLLNSIQYYQQQIIFPFGSASSDPALFSLNVSVTSDSEDLQYGIDESYTLSVTTSSAEITAATIFGAMHGLESFSQLVVFDYIGDSYTIPNTPIQVNDQPRFPWRGLLVDTSRHYLELSTLYAAIDALSYNKMNVLHWHAVDAESFPVQVPSFPLLSEKGAYAPIAIYNLTDIAGVVAYGKQRGVRVVPEFDVPGHAASWGLGYPNITATCDAAYEQNVNNIPLDPSNPLTFEILNGVMKDMVQVFNDTFWHTGGDEVVLGCWLQDPNIVTFMKEKGFTSVYELEQYFVDNVVAIAQSLGRDLVVWEDLFDNNITLPNSTVVEVWSTGSGTIERALRAGYRVLSANAYYLNMETPDAPSTHYEWVDTWQDFYLADPYDGIDPSLPLNNILGGEAAMWGEQVDSVCFESRVWPRASGVSERMWSDQLVNNITSAIPRLASFRCRMAQRGVGAGPILPDYCPLPSSFVTGSHHFRPIVDVPRQKARRRNRA